MWLQGEDWRDSAIVSVLSPSPLQPNHKHHLSYVEPSTPTADTESVLT